jgi:tetratricopeptide (TPR) repeat protein
MKQFFLIFLCFGCSSLTKISKTTINTDPLGTSVYTVKGQGKVLLGQTPFSFNWNDFIQDKEGVIQIVLEKKGYEEAFLFLNEQFKKADIEVKLNPIKSQDVDLDNALDVFIAIQNEVRAKNYEVALTKSKTLIENFPNSKVVNELVGSIYYLMNQKQNALSYYERAILAEPQNIYLQKIVESLKRTKQ